MKCERVEVMVCADVEGKKDLRNLIGEFKTEFMLISFIN